jgi:hypothetical protein
MPASKCCILRNGAARMQQAADEKGISVDF